MNGIWSLLAVDGAHNVGIHPHPQAGFSGRTIIIKIGFLLLRQCRWFCQLDFIFGETLLSERALIHGTRQEKFIPHVPIQHPRDLAMETVPEVPIFYLYIHLYRSDG
jgi:hypothetical protein